MSLNPAERKFGEYLEARKRANPNKPLEERTLDDLREATKVLVQHAGDHPNVSYADKNISTSDGFLIPIRIYNDHLPDDTPTLIFYPGCAFVFDLFATNGIICSRIAAHADIKVILVQFRLAPEHAMPTSLHDAYDSAVYVAAHADSFKIDPEKIILGGWCSGAHCATAVSSLSRQSRILNVSHQILLSGSYDLAGSLHDFDVYEQEDKTVSRSFLAYIARKYYGLTLDDYRHPLISPFYESDLGEMPATTILAGEYDALRSDSEAYFDKLTKAGIPTDKIILKGQTHNTVAMRKTLSDGSDPAELIANVIRSKIGNNVLLSYNTARIQI